MLPDMVGAARRRERPRWYVELPLVVGGYLLFGLARAAVDRGDPAATDNERLAQRLEAVLHLDVEASLNAFAAGHLALISATGYFYRLCLLAVPAVLVWLYATSPDAYRRWRSVFVLPDTARPAPGMAVPRSAPLASPSGGSSTTSPGRTSWAPPRRGRCCGSIIGGQPGPDGSSRRPPPPA